ERLRQRADIALRRVRVGQVVHLGERRQARVPVQLERLVHFQRKQVEEVSSVGAALLSADGGRTLRQGRTEGAIEGQPAQSLIGDTNVDVIRSDVRADQLERVRLIVGAASSRVGGDRLVRIVRI